MEEHSEEIIQELLAKEIMKDEGLVSITFCLDNQKKLIPYEPKITTKGFIYNDPNLVGNLETLIKNEAEKLLASNANFAQLKTNLKTIAGQYIYRKTERKPMIALAILNKNV